MNPDSPRILIRHRSWCIRGSILTWSICRSYKTETRPTPDSTTDVPDWPRTGPDWWRMSPDLPRTTQTDQGWAQTDQGHVPTIPRNYHGLTMEIWSVMVWERVRNVFDMAFPKMAEHTRTYQAHCRLFRGHCWLFRTQPRIYNIYSTYIQDQSRIHSRKHPARVGNT